MCMCLTRFTDVFIYFKLTNTIKEILKQLWVDLDSFCFIKVFFIIPQSCVILLGSPQIRVELFDYFSSWFKRICSRQDINQIVCTVFFKSSVSIWILLDYTFCEGLFQPCFVCSAGNLNKSLNLKYVDFPELICLLIHKLNFQIGIYDFFIYSLKMNAYNVFESWYFFQRPVKMVTSPETFGKKFKFKS
jgi:hypothetical protein